MPGDRRERRADHEGGDEPGHDHDGEHIHRRTAERIGQRRGTAGQARSHRDAEPGCHQHADDGHAEYDQDRNERLPGHALGEGTGDARRDNGADDDADDEAGQAQHADDEALPVARYRERCDQRDQDQVEQVTGHSINL